RPPPFRCRSRGARAPAGSPSVPPRSAAAPRGRRPTGLFGFLPQLAGGVARSAEGARSAGPLGNSRVSHGSLRSRPLPAFGRTPPFRWRSTGEKSFGGSSSVPPCRCRSTGETSDWPLWISPPACWGSGTKCRGGAVRRTAGKLQGVSWLASLAPPTRLRPYSPLPLALHGPLPCQLGGVEGSPDPSDDVAFGGPDGFFLGFAFAHAAGDVGSCFSSGFELGSDDQVDHLVGLSVAAPVEPVSLLTARRGV